MKEKIIGCLGDGVGFVKRTSTGHSYITKSTLYKEIMAKQAHLTQLLDEVNGEVSPNEAYRASATFAEFVKHFKDVDKAWELWESLNFKYQENV